MSHRIETLPFMHSGHTDGAGESGVSAAFLARRRTLRRLGAAGLAMTASGLLVPSGSAFAQSSGATWRPDAGPAIPKWPQPRDVRQVWLTRPHKKGAETVVARYFDGQQMRMDQYGAICHVMRDVQAGVTAYIDIELLDLLFAMQKWLVEWGIDRPLTIHSGYRTAQTNNRIEGAAKQSMHLQGRAADISIPGIPSDYLGRLAAIFARGGVGFYVSRGFVHIDTGTIRYWGNRR